MCTGKQYLKKVLTKLQIFAKLFKTKPIHANLTFFFSPTKLGICSGHSAPKTLKTAPGKSDCSIEQKNKTKITRRERERGREAMGRGSNAFRQNCSGLLPYLIKQA